MKLITDEEGGRDSATIEHNGSAVLDLPIEAIIRQHAISIPDMPAVTFGNETLSYGEFQEWSSRLANGFSDIGVKAGQRVAVVLKNCAESYLTLVAARKIGAVQVAINWRYSAEEIAWIVNDAAADIIVLDCDLVEMTDQILEKVGRPVRVFVAGEGGPEPVSLRRWALAYPANDDGEPSQSADVAIQLYTSGTSGWPKGALITNGNLASFFHNVETAMPIRRHGAQLIHLPLFHVAALMGSLRTFALGGHCVGQRVLDPAAALDLIDRHQISDFVTVNTVLAMLAEASQSERKFTSLEGIIVGGGALNVKDARRFVRLFDCPLYSTYGSTELTFGVTILRIDEELLATRPALLESCGVPMEDVEIGIFDSKTETALPSGESGELWVRGGQRSLGYWNNPTATKEAYREDGWFRTGDIGRIVDDHLYISDRLKDMVKTGGENVYPAEVERRLSEHPDVVEAIVFGVPDKKWGESVYAQIIPRAGIKVDTDEVLQFARERLAGFKCPKAIEIVDDVPRTPSGKPKKNIIREKFWKDHDRKVG